ncbi:MAG: hypothetical protein JSV56_02535 [Methanomassiliicoccales archaeon]|nr:MAG: hypothetical protein JSV56_02535 [Methanomassiliicoccales archaeon]
MKPEDKFGRPIYNHIYSQLLNIGMKLSQCGYNESSNKPNLFYKSLNIGVVFADMRGTEEVSIWEDPVPLVYFNFNKGIPIWKQVRIRKDELEKLDNNECPYRFSFYELDNIIELLYSLSDKEKERFGDDHFINFHYFYDEEFPNGFCKRCGKDIKDDSYHCSEECREMEYRKILAKTVNESPHCKVCKKKIIEYGDKEMIKEEFGIVLPDKLIKHHIRYDPEMIIYVCAPCHNKIHHSKDERLKSFLPEDSKPKNPLSSSL